MPNRTGVNHGPLMLGIETPSLSAANPVLAVSAAASATATVPSALQILCLLLMLLSVSWWSFGGSGKARRSFAASRAHQRLIERDRENERGADHHHLCVGGHVELVQAVRQDAH